MLQEEFATYVQEKCAGLIDNLAMALGVPLAITNSSDQELLQAPRNSDESQQPYSGPRTSIPIETEDGVVGNLIAITAEMKYAGMLQSLADEIGSRFALECDIDRMTNDLLHSYDQVNLLCKYARVLRPDDELAANTGRLLKETADLVSRRLLVQHFPKLAGTKWRTGTDMDVTDSLAWLVTDQTTFTHIFDEICEEFGDCAEINPVEAQLRKQGTAETPFGPVEYFIIPLWVQRTIHGFVGYFKAENEPSYETSEVRIVETLTEEIGNAVAAYELNQEIRQLVFNIVRTLVVTIEAKDRYTKGHSTRVYRLSELIAERLELTDQDIRHLRWAAILHDIGKIAIDNEILNKPGKLTDEEYEIIKTHPVEGAAMLEPISQLHEVIPGVRHHHERYDGDGYPDRLQGEQIPLFGRIIAIADTFDAIASVRPYRKVANPQRALKVVGEGAGTQFDPNISQAFLDLAEEGMLDEFLIELGETIGTIST